MKYNLVCRLNQDGKHVDIIFAKQYGIQFGQRERKLYIFVPAHITQEQAAMMNQFVDGKPRFQIALKTLKQHTDINKRNVANKSMEYQPFEKEPKRGIVSKIFRKHKEIFTFNDLVDRSKP